LKIKSSIINTNNCLNKVFPFLNKELSLGFHLVDTFSDCFYFYSVNQKDADAIISHQNKLDSIYGDSLINLDTVLIISDTSVKNNMATLILYIYRGQEIITKSIHHTINITFSETELFGIKCSINHTTQL